MSDGIRSEIAKFGVKRGILNESNIIKHCFAIYK